jgi:hypothetical protein
MLHAIADWSEARADTAANSVAATLLQAFAQLGGPAPDAWVVDRWRHADTELPLGAVLVRQADGDSKDVNQVIPFLATLALRIP